MKSSSEWPCAKFKLQCSALGKAERWVSRLTSGLYHRLVLTYVLMKTVLELHFLHVFSKIWLLSDTSISVHLIDTHIYFSKNLFISINYSHSLPFTDNQSNVFNTYLCFLLCIMAIWYVSVFKSLIHKIVALYVFFSLSAVSEVHSRDCVCPDPVPSDPL